MALTENSNFKPQNKKFVIILLLVIIGIAVFFRVWQLSSVPPGLYPDVAMNGNDALQSLQQGNFKLFYPDNNGREGLYMWLLATSFLFFGASIWSLKFVGALAGVLTVLGIYLLTKELLKKVSVKFLAENNQYIALLSAFFLATSFWHTNFSRIGFRAVLLPLVLVFSFYFLFLGLHNKKPWSFLLSGVIFGLGFYTYTSFRLAPLILIFLFVPYLFVFRNKDLQKKYLISAAILLFFIIITALPLGFYFIHNSQDFISRAAPVSVFEAENPIKEIGKSLILHLGIFNVYGDPNWRHNFAGAPMLPRSLGLLFLFGAFYALGNILKIIKHKTFFKDEDFGIFGFLLCFLLVMLLPGILTKEGIPHALRIVGVIPVVYMLSAIGAWWLYEKLKATGKYKKIILGFTVLFLVFIAFSESYKYFYLWGKNQEVEKSFNTDYANIGSYLNSLPQDTEKYVVINEPGSIVYGISIAAQTPMFIESTKFGEPRASYIKFEDLNPSSFGEKTVAIIPLYPEKTIPALAEVLPQGTILNIENFWVYFIPK